MVRAIIDWMPHARSHEAKDRKLLVSAVLKKHFNHSNCERFDQGMLKTKSTAVLWCLPSTWYESINVSEYHWEQHLFWLGPDYRSWWVCACVFLFHCFSHISQTVCLFDVPSHNMWIAITKSFFAACPILIRLNESIVFNNGSQEIDSGDDW